jgi:hypothetical protein
MMELESIMKIIDILEMTNKKLMLSINAHCISCKVAFHLEKECNNNGTIAYERLNTSMSQILPLANYKQEEYSDSPLQGKMNSQMLELGSSVSESQFMIHEQSDY